MKRAALAIVCCAALLASAGAAAADPTFDSDIAIRYLQAAKSGDDDAQFYLGALYSAGVGVPRSDDEAFRWFSRAADQGHAHAMLILAGGWHPPDARHRLLDLAVAAVVTEAATVR